MYISSFKNFWFQVLIRFIGSIESIIKIFKFLEALESTTVCVLNNSDQINVLVLQLRNKTTT